MSNLMKLLGTVLALGGLVLGVLTFVKPGVMDVYGIKLDTAAILFIGGVLALGLGAVVDALREASFAATPSRLMAGAVATPPAAIEPVVAEKPTDLNNFGRKAVEATVVTGAAAAVVAAVTTKPAKSDPVADTINALEQAKADVIKSMGGMETLAPTPPPPAPAAVNQAVVHPQAEEVETSDEDAEGGDLYVVEEKVVRGRPARILSDDTVEAETDEGWMRFENLEHLNEYLDSVEEQNA